MTDRVVETKSPRCPDCGAAAHWPSGPGKREKCLTPLRTETLGDGTQMRSMLCRVCNGQFTLIVK